MSAMQDIVYPAVFHYDASQKAYLVSFPDFAGVTEGDTLEEAYHMAGDCLLCMVDGICNLPPPSPYENVVRDYPNDIVLLVKPCYWVHPNLRK